MTYDALQIGNAYWNADRIARVSFIKAKQLAKTPALNPSRCIIVAAKR